MGHDERVFVHGVPGGEGIGSGTPTIGVMEKDLAARLRPAMEAALATARKGREATPPVEVNPALAPFLRFRRLPGRALDVVREVVESDSELRERTVAAVEPDEVGELGWIWLTQAEGWSEAVSQAEEESSARQRLSETERARKSLQKRLTRTEAVLDASRSRILELESELDVMAAEVTAVREERDRLLEEISEIRRREQGQRERVALLSEEAVTARARLGEERSRSRSLREQIAALETELENRRETDLSRDREEKPVGPTQTSVTDGPGSVPPAPTVGDPRAAALAVAAAARATEALGRALSDAAAALAPSPPRPSAEPPSSPEGPAKRRAKAPRRTPLRAARGVPDDSREGIAGLLTTPGIRVLIDGYNVAKEGWPQLSLDRQRERFLAGLATLVGNRGPMVDVVFDGADVVGGHRSTNCPFIRVSWSPPGVEADDEILAMIDAISVETPVLTISSDRRVRDGARDRGSNTASSRSLLELLGKS